MNRRIVEPFQPEAFYAFAEDGQRTIILVFDLADSSQIPVLTEPMYQEGKVTEDCTSTPAGAAST